MRYGLKWVSRRRGDALTRVRWDRLEHLLAGWYRDKGYAVEHVGTGATSSAFDGGIDLKLRRRDDYLLVQVKHWNVYKVPHNGTYIDPCAKNLPHRPLSEAEARASKRKADAAMEVLRNSTPEM